MSINEEEKLAEQVKKLRQKYDSMGQDITSYLDGLLYSEYLTYWDYIHLDTLLSLQSPKTTLKDEKVFIIYHQISELYFNLVLWELEQILEKTSIDEQFMCSRLDRIIRYFQCLENSFDIMVDGMDRAQFLKFRMALLPSSGFQSAQYRLIEFACTDLDNLVTSAELDKLPMPRTTQDMMDNLYWRMGATEMATGNKTLTLKQFEKKYMHSFNEAVSKHEGNNLRSIFKRDFSDSSKVIERLRELDQLANVLWPLAHMKSAAKYLHKDAETISATGGTNWQKYLPPRFQKISFFPELWDKLDFEEWGKAAVLKVLQ